jgi:O-antigen/teichoic acid export membrane protein
MSADALLPDASTDRLVHSTFALLISNGTGIVLGVGFWAVAARLYHNPKDVGRGAEEVQAMTFLAAFALLNMGTVFPRFLYAAGARAGVIMRSGYAAGASIALLASTVFILFFPHHYIAAGVLPSAIFVASVVVWTIFTIEDAALVGLRATFLVPIENTSFSVAKIALLPVFVVIAPHVGVYSSWVLPLIGCVAAVNLYLWRKVLPDHVRRSSGAGVLPHPRVIKNVVLGEYLGGLSFTAMATVPVLMVGATLGTTYAAYIQTPWLAGMSFDALLFSFATSLIVEATARPTAAPATVKRTVRLALLILGPSMLVLLVGAPWFLRILGPSYAAHGTTLLRLLALALPFMAINVFYVTYARLARRVRRVFLVQVSIAACVLTLCAVLLRPLGIPGAGVAYLGGQGLMAMILLPSVVRQYRHPDMAPTFPGAALVARSSGARPPAETPPTSGNGGAAPPPVAITGAPPPSAATPAPPVATTRVPPPSAATPAPPVATTRVPPPSAATPAPPVAATGAPPPSGASRTSLPEASSSVREASTVPRVWRRSSPRSERVSDNGVDGGRTDASRGPTSDADR